MPTYSINGVDVAYNTSATPQITVASAAITGSTDVYVTLYVTNQRDSWSGITWERRPTVSTTGVVDTTNGSISPLTLVASPKFGNLNGMDSYLYIYKASYIPPVDFMGDVEISVPSSGVFSYSWKDVTGATLNGMTGSVTYQYATRTINISAGDTVSASVDTEVGFELNIGNQPEEGQAFTISVGSKNIADTYQLSYEVSRIGSTETVSSDFIGPISGPISLSNGQASLSFSPTADQLTEGNEDFKVTLRNAQGQIVAEQQFTVLDTSVTPWNVIDGSAGGGFPGTNNPDRIEGGDKAMFVSAGGGDDLIIDSTQVDRLVGDAGNDTIESHSGEDWLQGEDGDDKFILTSDDVWDNSALAFNVLLMQFAGHYVNPYKIEGLGRLDRVVDGGLGADTLELGDQSEALFFHDSMSAFYQDDSLALTNDFLGNASTKRLIGIETIKAGAGDDLIDMTSLDYSYNTNVVIYGEDGNDTIWATDLSDTIDGGAGDDVIFSGGGYDQLYGGAGSDTFEFTVNSGTNIISDFNLTEDSLLFYARNGRGDEYTDAGYEALKLNNGVVEWQGVTVDISNSGIESLDELDVAFYSV